MVDPGLFRQKYAAFEVEVGRRKWRVQRRERDFYFLREILAKMYPACVIPLLPCNPLKEFTTNSMERRKECFQHFLDEILLHPLLSTATFLYHFLSAPDKDFEVQKYAFETLNPPRNVSECYSNTGVASVSFDKFLGQFCNKVTNSSPLLKENFAAYGTCEK